LPPAPQTRPNILTPAASNIAPRPHRPNDQRPVTIIRTPTGGIVLDPFAGSGTTALACIPEGRDYILIEKEPEYAEICRRRIAEYTGEEITPKEIELADNQKVKQMSLW
jgi:16S rRNA G966 N2-methylase RsmD